MENEEFTYFETTDDVLIEVEPHFVPEQSDPAQEYFFFSYCVRISNFNLKPIRLMARHWIITDGKGETKEVEGDGVVGQQPTLKTDESFEYTSFCPLPTPTGNMRGRYLFRTDEGKTFYVNIPVFFLRHEELIN